MPKAKKKRKTKLLIHYHELHVLRITVNSIYIVFIKNCNILDILG